MPTLRAPPGPRSRSRADAVPIVSHQITGLEAMRRHLDALSAAARSATAAALSDVAQGVAAEIRATLDQATSGASLPGAPPADPSGRLAASVSVDTDPDAARSVVTVSAPLAQFLEFGTVRMAARPFLRPAVLRAHGTAKARLAQTLRRGLKP